MKTVLVTFVALVAITVAGALAVIYSGSYNIGTGNHDNALMNWVFRTAMTRSVKEHAASIKAPPLSDPAMVKIGFAHYNEMCVACHGAPGIKPDEISEGLWPKAPNLAKHASDWTPGQLFWIIKHGVKFTAMPAWGPSHDDKKIWAMVAFIEKLRHMTPAEYQKMQASSKPDNDSD